MQLLKSYHIHKATWPWASLNVQKDDTKVNVKHVWDIDMENIRIKV